MVMHFEQTNEWARFQYAMGRRFFAFSCSPVALFAMEGKRAPGDGIAIEKKIIGRWVYLEVHGWEFVSRMTHERAARVLAEAGKKANAVFVRWTSPWEIPNPNLQIPLLKGVKVIAPTVLVRQMPPKATLVIDLEKGEEKLLQGMHEKTRYNIRLAERKGVAAGQVSVQDGFEKFWALMRDTARRDAIGIHAKAYYRKMLEIVQGEEATTHLFLAQHADAPLAAALLVVSGDTATYLHGGSSSVQRNLMAPYLLQWRMMQFARAQGMRWYDMWGVAPASGNNEQGTMNRTHPWAGITRFKTGFGGEVREGAGTFDIVCRPAPYRVLSLGRLLKDLIE